MERLAGSRYSDFESFIVNKDSYFTKIVDVVYGMHDQETYLIQALKIANSCIDSVKLECVRDVLEKLDKKIFDIIVNNKSAEIGQLSLETRLKITKKLTIKANKSTGHC